jgi:hypothetical protein
MELWEKGRTPERSPAGRADHGEESVPAKVKMTRELLLLPDQTFLASGRSRTSCWWKAMGSRVTPMRGDNFHGHVDPLSRRSAYAFS